MSSHPVPSLVLSLPVYESEHDGHKVVNRVSPLIRLLNQNPRHARRCLRFCFFWKPNGENYDPICSSSFDQVIGQIWEPDLPSLMSKPAQFSGAGESVWFVSKTACDKSNLVSLASLDPQMPCPAHHFPNQRLSSGHQMTMPLPHLHRSQHTTRLPNSWTMAK